MLPQDQLQQFIVRAVTGYGDRVQGDVNDALLKVSESESGWLQRFYFLTLPSYPLSSYPFSSYLA
jgi:hypothetical protein